MKWNSTSRGMKALAVSLAVGCGMTACSRDYTAAYLYVTNAKASPGLITAYAVDYQSGALEQLADSPIPSGGVNPVTLVASPNGKFLYVLNHDAPSSNVVEFSIGTDGKIYAENTYSVVTGGGLTGTLPTAAAIDAAGKFLYVTFTYQNGFTAAKPGPGGVAVFPINADGSLGTPLTNTITGTTLPYYTVGNNPVGIMASQLNNYLYVIDDERPTGGAPFGVMLEFTENPSTGALTPVAGPVSGGFAAGTTPSSIAGDPTGVLIYVTDSTTNQIYAYSEVGNVPVANVSSPYATGLFPINVKVDPRGTFVYVTNFTSSTVNSYTINKATGALSAAGGSTGVATGPTCVTIEPALGIYLYTSNNTDNSVSAEQLNPHTGALTAVQGTQFSSQGLPTCAVAVANGAHATQIVE